MIWAGPLSKDYGKKPWSKTAAYGEVQKQKREDSKRRSAATFTWADWYLALRNFDYQCAYCRANKPLEQDHFIPLSKLGSHSAGNIVPACRSCNARKSSKMPEKWCQTDVYRRIIAFLKRRDEGSRKG